MVNGCLYAWGANSGTGEVSAKETALGLWFADLPTTVLLAGAEIEFILNCELEQHEVDALERPCGHGGIRNDQSANWSFTMVGEKMRLHFSTPFTNNNRNSQQNTPEEYH